MLLAGTIYMVIYLYKVSINKTISHQDVVAKKDYVRKLPETLPSVDFWPNCTQNKSAANITGFSTLPQQLQNFLYYKHCRHFPMILDVPNKCGGAERSQDIFLLLVIKTIPANYDRREGLRKTWAKERLHNGVWIRRVFVAGTTNEGFQKKRLNTILELEQTEYNDILQWDFEDSLYNLTLKQILILQWIDKKCPNVQYILNGDDDVLANTGKMVEYLQGLQEQNVSNHLFTGHVIFNAYPIRSTLSKYYVPPQVHDGKYPPYCSGAGFLLSGYTAAAIFNASHTISLLPIDDVYIGMCLEKAGLKPKPHIAILDTVVNIPSKKVDIYDPCFYREFLLVHRFLSGQLYLMWQRINDPNLKCSGFQK